MRLQKLRKNDFTAAPLFLQHPKLNMETYTATLHRNITTDVKKKGEGVPHESQP